MRNSQKPPKGTCFASLPRDYQEDWQKRLREFRVLGWEVENTANVKRSGARLPTRTGCSLAARTN